ncbi:glycosyltransferase family 2 protein [Limosilactobacillus reuteri]|uniref:glycosyltransferase family 2 protein n=1 Tax=Limosilactobacillus reuteri TaxID=1598 RepID=UPI001581EE63|nr:glycosyltransferase family 2 protein [Limosilactobacillus reuteri]QKT15263.1 glycosyltransferase family 2 protein [Limosilactobacillus reuteri]
MLERKNINPSISVIVPVFNVEAWIEKCIYSILSQSFEDYELVIVDDGSTDNSSKICKSLSLIDKRIKYFYKENGGLSDARNYGLKKATGEYIVFIDSDDYIDKNYLYLLFNSIKKNNSDVAVCGFKWVDEKGNIIHNVPISNIEQQYLISGKKLLYDVFNSEGYAFIVVWNKIYKKEIFNHLSFDVNRLYEDEFINYKLFWNVHKVSIVNQQLYYYVQRDGSIKNSDISIKKIKDFNDLHKERMLFYKSKDKSLYFLASKAYRNWIVSTFEKYYSNLPLEFRITMQKEYRKLKKEDPRSMESTLMKVQDIIAYISLPLASWIRRTIYILKKEQ